MLVENKEAKARSMGKIYLLPGVNDVNDVKWKRHAEGKWKGPIEGLIEDGTIVVHDASKKLTVEIVKKTYDAALLEEWALEPKNKGPLRGAINKQLKLVSIEKKADPTDSL